MSAHRLTTHARLTRSKTRGTTYVGVVRIQDGPARWTASTQIHRRTRADALADAENVRHDLLRQAHNASHATPGQPASGLRTTEKGRLMDTTSTTTDMHGGYTICRDEGTDSLGTAYVFTVVLSHDGEEVYRHTGSDWYREQARCSRWLNNVLR
jgi:hypothetical protein